MMTGTLPQNAVDEINKYIDGIVIKENKDSSPNLVGQINRDKKSSQLDFDLKSPYGQNFKGMLDGCEEGGAEGPLRGEGGASAAPW